MVSICKYKSRVVAADVQCICGNVLRVEKDKTAFCQLCGAEIYIVKLPDGSWNPYTRIQEDSIDERKKAGKQVVNSRADIVGWYWSDGERQDA